LVESRWAVCTAADCRQSDGETGRDGGHGGFPGQATKRADAFGNLIFTNAPDPTTNNFWRIRPVP
jgi:hypothetical protein